MARSGPGLTAPVALLLAAFGAQDAAAQPAPSFLATCETLRDSLSALDADDGELVTISVQGAARIATRDHALAYISVCSPPHPHVLCVTYDLSGRRAGDQVILTGALEVLDDMHIMLDPCLASTPEPGAGAD